jgi:hypothetical protein
MDKTANVVFITNMTRGGNHYAGVEGIIELQKCASHRKIPIFVYVADKKRAWENIELKKKDISSSMQSIVVGNQLREIENFLKTSIQIDFS